MRQIALLAIGAGLLWPALPEAEPTASGWDLERQLSEVANRVNPGVVAVSALREVPTRSGERSRCQGSGVILEGGLIATTLSVAGPGDDITVRYADNETSPAHVVAVDPLLELSLLRPVVTGGRAMAVGHPDSLHAGSWVFVVGFSLSSPEATLASGRFSSRTILNLNDSSPDTIELLQLEANVYPGNSGAAVIDSRGRLVGIILGGLRADGFLDPAVLSSFAGDHGVTQGVMMTDPPLGISFALPADAVARMAQSDLPDRPGYPGIRVEMGVTSQGGVRVQDVMSGSPAAVAGIRQGDRITAINGEPVPDPQSLASVIRNLRPGTTARLEYVSERTDLAQEADIVLGDYTADYRVRLIWHRLLDDRMRDLEDARDHLQHQLDLLDRELTRVNGLSPAATKVSTSSP